MALADPSTDSFNFFSKIRILLDVFDDICLLTLQSARKYKMENDRHRQTTERLAMLEVQLQQQQEALKQAQDSRKQRDNDKVLSLERQLADVNDRLLSETDSYNKYKKMYSDMQQVRGCDINRWEMLLN